jgi:hypothetical protein
MNPNRECKICDMTSSYFGGLVEKYSDSYRVFYLSRGNDSDSVVEYRKKYGIYACPNHFADIPDEFCHTVLWKKDVSIKEIIEDCESCPVCVLALLKITGLISMPGMDYNYDEEFKAWQSSKECEQPGYYGYL